MSARSNDPMRRPLVICAWCKALLSRGVGPPSHGVCGRCLRLQFGLGDEGATSEGLQPA
jgi:hypothetical protein